MAGRLDDGPLDAIAVAGAAEETLELILTTLGAAEQPVDIISPALFANAIGEALLGSMRHPVKSTAAAARALTGTLAACSVAVNRALGGSARPPLTAEADDRRFDDPAWADSPFFLLLQQLHLLQREWLDGLLD